MTRKPGYVLAGVFAANYSLAWIPDMSTITLSDPTETPDGTITSFTFTSAPRFVLYQGQWRFENMGYVRSGSAIQLCDQDLNVFAPDTGESVKAIL
jgi:hypothetical protein